MSNKEYVLENDVLFGGAILRAGKLIDDAAFNIDALESCGARLIPADPVSMGMAEQLVSLRQQGRTWQADPGVPITTNLKSTGSTTFLTQPYWAIDGRPGKGSDSNDGKSAVFTNGKRGPLATVAEWQRRVGRNSILAPVGGRLLVEVIGANPDPTSDPLVFWNTMAPGCTAEFRGQPIVLRTGSFTAVVDKDRGANIPNKVTDSSLSANNGWSKYLGMCIEVTSGDAIGVRAFIARDLAPNGGTAKTAHVTARFNPTPDIGGGVSPGGSPIAGDSYRIIDYTHVAMGLMQVGYDQSRAAEQEGIPVGGLLLNQFHMERAEEPSASNISLPGVAGSADTLVGFANCITDVGVECGAGGAFGATIGNCSIDRGLIVGGGQVFHMGGLNRNTGGNYPGGGEVNLGTYYGYEPCFVGSPGDQLLLTSQASAPGKVKVVSASTGVLTKLGLQVGEVVNKYGYAVIQGAGANTVLGFVGGETLTLSHDGGPNFTTTFPATDDVGDIADAINTAAGVSLADVYGGGAADFQCRPNGHMDIAMASVWDSIHGIFSVGGPIWGGEDFFFGENNFPAFWGTNPNGNGIFLSNGGNIRMSCFTFDTAPIPPSVSYSSPTIAQFSPGLFGADGTGYSDVGYSFDGATGLMVPPGGVALEWANFTVAAPAGFIENVDGTPGPDTFVIRSACAQHPGSGCRITFQSGTYTPP